MKKRLLLFLGIAVLGLALGLWLVGPANDRVVYEGKSLEDWSLQLFGAPAQAEREEAAAALKRMGPAAVPGLIKQLRTREPFFHKQAWAITAGLPARMKYKLLGRGSPLQAATLRAAAARSLGMIGPEAAPAVPYLSRALRDSQPQVSIDAAAALGHIGPASVPELTTALADKNSSVRHMAAYGLGELGPGAVSAIPALLQSLADENEYVRSSAAHTLSRIGEPARQAVLEAVAKANGPKRQAAAKALAGFNGSAQEGIPPLLKMMSDEEPGCRAQAITTLTTLRALNLLVITNISNALKDPSSEVRLAALAALSEASWKARPAIPLLIECLKDPTALVRIGAAHTLGKIGPAAKSALPALTGLTEEKNEAVRAAATEAIAQIDPREHPDPDSSPR